MSQLSLVRELFEGTRENIIHIFRALVKDLPICTPDGFFAKLQSNASSSTYYCSDREGNAIESFHGIPQDSTEGMESVIF